MVPNNPRNQLLPLLLLPLLRIKWMWTMKTRIYSPIRTRSWIQDCRNGKKTSYFHNELSEEAKQLIGDIAPKKLDPATAAPATTTTSGDKSSWNHAGTWEERDVYEMGHRIAEGILAQGHLYLSPIPRPLLERFRGLNPSRKSMDMLVSPRSDPRKSTFTNLPLPMWNGRWIYPENRMLSREK